MTGTPANGDGRVQGDGVAGQPEDKQAVMPARHRAAGAASLLLGLLQSAVLQPLIAATG